jgi:hypothetical protein
MLFKEVIPVYTADHTKPTNTNCRTFIVEADDKCIYHCSFKGLINYTSLNRQVLFRVLLT